MHQVNLPVRSRLIVVSDGSRSSTAWAFCPSQRRPVSIGECRTCANAQAVSSETVVCRPPGATPRTGEDAPAGSAAMARVTLVRANVGGELLAELSRAVPWSLPVVDHEDRFLGVVSPRLLEALRLPWHRAASTLACEVVHGSSLLVLDTAPLGDALRFMARRRARSTALVDGSGVFQGVLRDVDALRVVQQ